LLTIQGNDISQKQRALLHQDTSYGGIEESDTTSGAVMNQYPIGTDILNPITNKTNDNLETAHNTTNTQTRLDTAETIHKDQSNNQNNYDKEEKQGQDTTGLDISESTTTLSEISTNQQIENNNNNQNNNNKNIRKRTTIRIDDETPAQIRIRHNTKQEKRTLGRIDSQFTTNYISHILPK
jgi:hypothetical protein